MANAALRWMIAGEWRQHPGRIAVAALAIAVGVALGFAVHLVNGSALTSFGQAIRTVNGAADLQIKAASVLGLDEALYGRVAMAAGVADASPVVTLKAQTANGEAIPVLGLDVIRAANVTPTTIGVSANGPGTGASDPFATDALFLSRAALAAAGVRVGERLAITANGRTQTMVVRGGLPGAADVQRLGVIDIAAAQVLFGRLGRIDRIDLKLAEGADPGAVRASLGRLLPPDAILSDGDDQAAQSDALSRAYRVNLDMLALVALLTGSFLVYATQSLSVARRLQAFALLRTLGLQKRDLIVLVATEGALAGLAGSVLGLLLGYAMAAGALALLGGDLGGGYFGDAPPPLIFAPEAALAFFALGMAAAIGGSVLPALQGAAAAPAVALKNAGDALDPRARPGLRVPLVLAALGIGAALMPAAARLPLFGYLSIAFLLATVVMFTSVSVPVAMSNAGARKESARKEFVGLLLQKLQPLLSLTEGCFIAGAWHVLVLTSQVHHTTNTVHCSVIRLDDVSSCLGPKQVPAIFMDNLHPALPRPPPHDAAAHVHQVPHFPLPPCSHSAHALVCRRSSLRCSQIDDDVSSPSSGGTSMMPIGSESIEND